MNVLCSLTKPLPMMPPVVLVMPPVPLISAEAAALRDNTNLPLLAFGWVFLAYSGRIALLTVSSGLDAAYGVDKRRHFWHRNAIAVGIIMGTVFSLLALSVVALSPSRVV